ncbi:MAG: type I methionyl aminopeptidase [Fimbriimonadales bacterium]
MIYIKTAPEIEIMRQCGRKVRLALDAMSDAIVPGKSTTADLDAIGEEVLRNEGAVPSFKGYKGFPAAVCISVNDEVVHGIPGPRLLLEGDIVSLDIGAFFEGFHGDSAWTYAVGEISSVAQRLLNVTKESLYQGIAQAREGNRTGDIGSAVASYVERHGYSAVRDLVGHGIGRSLHEEPNVPNFGKPGTGPRLKAGMTICIEPMINQGKYHVRCLADHWTTVTQDGKFSAHFEHMVLVTKGSPVILTDLSSSPTVLSGQALKA